MGRILNVLFVIALCSCDTFAAKNDGDNKKLAEGEKAMADQILKILEHYKQSDPVGMPGADIPDPMPIPKMKQSFSVAKMDFNNMNVYGLSKFRILYVKAEISLMEVNAALKIDKLNILGNYTMSSWLSKSQGPFTVQLTDVTVKGKANLDVERDGKLRAQDISMDIKFGKIAMNFENLGFMGSLFQGIINSVGNFLFDSIKPFVLKEAYAKLREEINKNLDNVAGDMEFPNSISPLDMVIADTRNKVRRMNLDPYLIRDYNFTKDFYKAQLTNNWVTGLSSFYRVGNINLSMENNTVIADFEIGTQRLEGRTNWEISFVGGLVSRAGTASFSIEYITVRMVLGQALDTRKRPQFKDLQLELGNIQVRCDGAGTIDYVVELAVNILPNLLRYQIMDAIEGPIREKVQEKLNTIDVERIIKAKVEDMDNGDTEKEGFKLSSLKEMEIPPVELPSDDFWNFD